jgi:hypothetical protein
MTYFYFMKDKSSVEQAIVDKALEMFNEKGVEYVGMRELAQSLDMRIGNLIISPQKTTWFTGFR